MGWKSEGPPFWPAAASHRLSARARGTRKGRLGRRGAVEG